MRKSKQIERDEAYNPALQVILCSSELTTLKEKNHDYILVS